MDPTHFFLFLLNLYFIIQKNKNKTPSTFFSTAGSPPFIPDIGTPTNTNEPYLTVRSSLLTLREFTKESTKQWLDFALAQENPPQTISTSYGDDEQTGTAYNSF